MRAFFAVLICGLMMCFSCASGKKSLKEHKGSYLESVKLNYDAGVEALKNEEYDKAITYFQFVRSKYPFSKYAALSDLKIADAKFAQKKWLDAASAYEVFIRLHPRHEEVAYASYRVGASYFHAVPGDFFLWPKATSRDQSSTKDAVNALDHFILQFPNSEHISDAVAKRALLFTYLAKHNQEIAGYYYTRSRYQAAADRYILVYQLYPDTKEAAESLFYAAQIFDDKLDNVDQAIELYTRLLDEKPDSEYAKKAQAALEKLLKKKNDEQ